MRWYKFVVYIGIFLLLIYSVLMLLVDESKTITLEKEINYPVQKVFPQFNDLQHFVQWNRFFAGKENLGYAYYTPYRGQGASMNYQNRQVTDDFGDLFIRYENPYHTLKYELFERKSKSPYKIDVQFVAEKNKTKIIWIVHTPRQAFFKRAANLFSENEISENINQSMQNLNQLLGGKVDKEILLSKIKYDTLLIEPQKSMMLLGINVSVSNKEGNAIKSIELNHNKVVNFVAKDLGKKEDEYGSPILVADAQGFKNKEMSYFYGVSLPQRIGISDNNFSFRTLNSSRNYVIYYKGSYERRSTAIGKLLQKAKNDQLRNGMLQEMFIETPDPKKEVKLKISLPVFK